MLDFEVGLEGTDKVEGLQVMNDLSRLCQSREVTDILHAVEIFWQAYFFTL